MSGSPQPRAEDRREAHRVAQAASAVLEPVYERLEVIADAVVGWARTGGAPSGPSAASGPVVPGVVPGAGLPESRLEGLPTLVAGLLAEDELAVGWGFVAAPGVIEGQDRFMSWWQRNGDGVRRLRLNFDPSSVDVYDYLQMDWFARAQHGERRIAYGPYVDYSGSELYIVTVSIPVVADGAFLGVAGADLSGELERRLVRALRSSSLDAVIVNGERRVIAANTPRWVFGSRLPASPTAPGPAGATADGAGPGADGFAQVELLPVGNGWLLALAESSAANP